MNPKALATLAIVSACQPISVYSMSLHDIDRQPATQVQMHSISDRPQELTVVDTYSFGIGTMPQSSITVFNDGNCDQVVFDNTLTGSTNVVTTRLGGHYIMVQMGSHTIPDVISVSPAAGYYVDGPDEISVEDGDIGTIVVCLQAMS